MFMSTLQTMARIMLFLMLALVLTMESNETISISSMKTHLTNAGSLGMHAAQAPCSRRLTLACMQVRRRFVSSYLSDAQTR